MISVMRRSSRILRASIAHCWKVSRIDALQIVATDRGRVQERFRAKTGWCHTLVTPRGRMPGALGRVPAPRGNGGAGLAAAVLCVNMAPAGATLTTALRKILRGHPAP